MKKYGEVEITMKQNYDTFPVREHIEYDIDITYKLTSKIRKDGCLDMIQEARITDELPSSNKGIKGSLK